MATIFDSSGRASLYLRSVSISLVASTLTGQAAAMGAPFDALGLVLVPARFVLGLATFNWATQSSVEDVLYAPGINRLRHLYLEFIPNEGRYYILRAHDDAIGVMRNTAMEPSRRRIFLMRAGTIGGINSVVAGIAVGLAVSLAESPLGIGVAAGRSPSP